MHVDRPPARDLLAESHFAARARRSAPSSQLSALARMRAALVLPTPRAPVKRNAWATRPLRDRVGQRARDVLLADELVEALGPVLAREDQVRHAGNLLRTTARVHPRARGGVRVVARGRRCLPWPAGSATDATRQADHQGSGGAAGGARPGRAARTTRRSRRSTCSLALLDAGTGRRGRAPAQARRRPRGAGAQGGARRSTSSRRCAASTRRHLRRAPAQGPDGGGDHGSRRSSRTSTSRPSTSCWRWSSKDFGAAVARAASDAGVTQGRAPPGAGRGARHPARHRPGGRGQVPGAREVHARPHRARRARASSTRSSAATRRSAASIQVLSRRTKNNPVLIGEPGVGKTAIVEGIAQRIAAGDVPESLQGQADPLARPRRAGRRAPSTAASSRTA